MTQRIPEMVEVKRSDPVYMAHAYLTKVPVPGIMPFIEAFTRPGDTVLDPFAGSGMTGVAALAMGRRAHLFDVSVLGRHIGTNYVSLVDADLLRKRAGEVSEQARRRLGNVYGVRCQQCDAAAQLVKTVWSMVMICGTCRQPVTFYRSLEAADWHKAQMQCPHCDAQFTSKAQRIAEEPVLDSTVCTCSRTQLEQDWTPPLVEVDGTGIQSADVPIENTRQMYLASALGRHGLTSTAAFYSKRNLVVLGALKEAIDEVDEPELRSKLRFAFTAILTRASKRYQWSRQRPLNAANANYYVAPVFYEWNVFDLFDRKVEAAIKSDAWIRAQRGTGTLFEAQDDIDVTYEIASANSIPLPNAAVDYVFMDPPFGSNIFYSDMNLFQEAWLGQTTDASTEAVVDRVDTGAERTAARYERILTDALHECQRVLKPGGYITIVFGNNSGAMWALLQRAIASAGLTVVPELIAILNKGQRSVKGLVSGFENVATLDLILTLQQGPEAALSIDKPTRLEVDRFVKKALKSRDDVTPSHLYLELLRHGLQLGWDLSQVDLRDVTSILKGAEATVHTKTGLVN